MAFLWLVSLEPISFSCLPEVPLTYFLSRVADVFGILKGSACFHHRADSITWNTGSQGGIGICCHENLEKLSREASYCVFNVHYVIHIKIIGFHVT